MQRIHYWVGVSGIIVFALTGQYMDIVHNHLTGMSDGPRMIYRSSHIYILLASLINLAFSFNTGSRIGKIKALQSIASLLMLASLVFLLIGFFMEPALNDLQRPYSRLGLYALFGVGVLLSLLGFKRSK